MTKKVKSRNDNGNWGGSAVSINGPITKVIDDGSSHIQTPEKKYRELMRNQLLEQEVRAQLKQKLKIFSKEIQNLVKRGIDYVKPLEKVANIHFNSMRKEQLK